MTQHHLPQCTDLVLFHFSSTFNPEAEPDGWTLTEEVKIVSWLLANNRTKYWAGNLLWKDVVRELGLSRCYKSVRVHFLSVIRPNLVSYRDLIDPDLAPRLDELRAAFVDNVEISAGNEVTPKTDPASPRLRQLPTKRPRPFIRFETMDEADEEMTIDVEGFTQSQGLNALHSLAADNSLLNLHNAHDRLDVASPDEMQKSPIKEESVDVPSCEPILKEEDSIEPPNYRPIMKEELTEISSIHLSLKEESLDTLRQAPCGKKESVERSSRPPSGKGEPGEAINHPFVNEESARLNSLKTQSTTSSGDSSMLLYNRCATHPSSSSSLSREAGESSDADSLAKLFGRASKPVRVEPKHAPPKEVKQAETIEEVVEELCAFYAVTPETAKRALRDARYSVKGAICRIINARNVSLIEACHRENH